MFHLIAYLQNCYYQGQQYNGQIYHQADKNNGIEVKMNPHSMNMKDKWKDLMACNCHVMYNWYYNYWVLLIVWVKLKHFPDWLFELHT